jgi:hypothetical protein
MAPNMIVSPTMTINFGTQDAVDYEKALKATAVEAIRRIKDASSGSVEQCSSLIYVLSTKSVYDVPKYVLPRIFKKKLLDKGSEIKIGYSKGTVQRELGRGANGVVVLLSVDSEANASVAVKAQASTSTLAMEFEILKRIEDRIGKRWSPEQASPFPFPRPLSFVALADGGMMSMTAASESGLTLVDLVNLYRQCNEKIEDLVPLHYATRMMHHLELLHGHGK